MDEKKHNFSMPKTKATKILLNALVTLLVGAIYFYISTPALNLHAQEFYAFVLVLCLTYVACALVTSGFHIDRSGGVKEYFTFIKSQCLPIGLVLLALAAIVVVGSVISMPIFRAGAYRSLLDVHIGNFAQEVEEISYNEIPMLDEASAKRLGTSQMGNLPDMVSQFEVADNYTQINYQGTPVRVTPLEYADLFKWFTNRGTGLPAYIVVDMVTQEVDVVRLAEGMKYSPSEPLNRNLTRHLRFQFPTFIFGDPSFEIDEEGNPWWVCPKIEMTIGLFGGQDINGAVLVNAVTGESVYYEAADVPTWADRVYDADMIITQYNYYGTFVNGFINSIIGQRDVTVTTAGYNYIALNGDVYMFTGVTSVSSDQSNLGFLLSNQRTKETNFYAAPGATELLAQNSAQGEVQDLGYQATWPLLLNIAGQPTYFMPLKDNNQLVKQYAMVNVAQYSTIVATDTTVAGCEDKYLDLLVAQNITTPEVRPETGTDGVIVEIRSAVLDGNTYFFFRLAGDDVFFTVSANENPLAVILNEGDHVTIQHEVLDESSSILEGYTITLS